MKTSRLRVTLRHVRPAVVRVIDVPASSTLPELHDLLQAAVGWEDRHRHRFVAGDTIYGGPDEEVSPEQDEAAARLSDLPPVFTYAYDFGDGWEHEVETIGSGPGRPGCGSGEGTCPPEDCGGPAGYARLLEVLADPVHPDHEELAGWAGDRADFDRAETDLRVRQVAGEVPESIRLVLKLAEGGVQLTENRRLPRGFVRQVQEARPQWSRAGRPAAVEDDLQPLAVLHDILRHVGLLRLGNGLLVPTRAAADDQQAVRRLRSWFGPGDFDSVLVELSVALLLAWAPRTPGQLAAAAFPLLGDGWIRDGHPLTVADVEASLHYLAADLTGLDLIAVEAAGWRPGTSARTLLPRVNALVRSLA